MICKQFTEELSKLHKKTISFILISAFLFSVTLESYTMPKVFATPETLHVYPGQSIQAAINAANSGDIISVDSGVYNENVMVNKSVSLIGKNPSNTIIDGNGTEMNTVIITSHTNNVKIENFTIQNGEGSDPANLRIVNSKGHKIRSNILRQSQYGLHIRDSNDSLIADNVIANNTNGIYIVNGNGNKIIGNLIKNNTNGAVTHFSGGFVTNIPNRFYHNNFVDNRLQVSSLNFATKWDNGVEGNYWTDYNGQDLNGDGIGDTNTPHLGVDYKPLMNRWSNTIPTVDFKYSPPNPREGQEIQFNDTSTDSHGAVVNWLWNFGDGNTSSNQNTTHKYRNRGTYNVTLTVTDDEGATNTFTKPITVTASPLDYTFYYVLIGIAAGALILTTALFLFRKKRKSFSSSKIVK